MHITVCFRDNILIKTVAFLCLFLKNKNPLNVLKGGHRKQGQHKRGRNRRCLNQAHTFKEAARLCASEWQTKRAISPKPAPFPGTDPKRVLWAAFARFACVSFFNSDLHEDSWECEGAQCWSSSESPVFRDGGRRASTWRRRNRRGVPGQERPAGEVERAGGEQSKFRMGQPLLRWPRKMCLCCLWVYVCACMHA